NINLHMRRGNKRMGLKQELLGLVRQIPEGQVSGYGVLGSFLSRPCSGLVVGKMLSGLLPLDDTPWWRVVGARGQVLLMRRSIWLGEEQKRLLEEEGVVFTDKGDVDMEHHTLFRDFRTGEGSCALKDPV
ncbi:MAG: MGMT family protein, partial [Myxococcota bacterium]